MRVYYINSDFPRGRALSGAKGGQSQIIFTSQIHALQVNNAGGGQWKQERERILPLGWFIRDQWLFPEIFRPDPLLYIYTPYTYIPSPGDEKDAVSLNIALRPLLYCSDGTSFGNLWRISFERIYRTQKFKSTFSLLLREREGEPYTHQACLQVQVRTAT